MTDYRKDINEIKELLKRIQKYIAQLEIKIDADQTTFTDYTAVPTAVPSTQACQGN